MAEGRGEALAAAVTAARSGGAPLALSDLAVSGEDLLAAGVPKGPLVGQVLRVLLDETLEDPARNTRDYLASRIPVHLARLRPHHGGTA
jgi:tRNA nucleotidyltransferase (CCA-adding enzyme)